MIGTTVSHYRIESLLGKGGMGEVYRAHDARLDRTVALKFLPHDRIRTDRERERFVREARSASALDHPNVGTIFDIQESEDGRTFLVMAYYAGETLRERLDRGRLTASEAIDMSVQVASGLSAAHAKSIVHRDIKPANILITESGLAKVVDFGLAKDLDATALTMAAGPMGTASYMSPEQAAGKPTDGRTDVWSLGVMLYEMLAGARPFDGSGAEALLYQVVHESPRPLGERQPDLPPDLIAVVDRAMAKDPQKRFASMDEMRSALAALTTASTPASGSGNRLALLAILVIVVAAAAWMGSRVVGGDSSRDELRAQLLVEVRELIGEGKDFDAFLKLNSAAFDIGSDPALLALFNECTIPVNVRSDPPGAAVYFRDYLDPMGESVLLGVTPIEQQPAPMSHLALRLELEGHRPRELTSAVFRTNDLIAMHRVDVAPPGSELVPAGLSRVGDLPPVRIAAFWIDTYEVNNEQYQEFVDAGGYQNEEYWKQPLIDDGRTLSWAEAMERFKDATGRPSPAGWELGRYAEGKKDHPVTGVSWYEAAAYLEFAGKQLPTVYHWRLAAGFGIVSGILALSNFESEGPEPVGRNRGLTPYGNYDMAGNVEEWCWNGIGGLRYSMGGAFSHAPFEFKPYPNKARSPFDRLPMVGFRGMLAIEPVAEETKRSFESSPVDFSGAPPVTDEVFALIREAYTYDETALDPRIESSSDHEDWAREKVSFRASYGAGRVPAHLFLPKAAEPPYQVVIYFPGGAAEYLSGERLTNLRYWDFVIKSGRALLYPVYENMHERRQFLEERGPSARRENIKHWGQDIRRSIDYLETRADIDADKIAYYSLSLGSTYAPIFLAVEPRFQCSVLLSGGLHEYPWASDVKPLNFVSRVNTPVLMVNGRHDFSLPLRTSVEPMLELLGTPAADKKLFLLEGDHVPRANEVVRVTLDWFDRYLGDPLRTF